MKNPITFIVSNAYKIGFIFLLIFCVIFGISYVFGSIETFFDKRAYTEDFAENYYDSEYFQEAQEHGLESFTQYSIEDINSMTAQEKIVYATKTASYLIVYDLKFDVLTNVKLENPKINILSFEYDAAFSQFTLNPKWEKFYGLSVFGDSLYTVNYKSMMYSNNDFSFPLNYKEETKFTSLEAWSADYSLVTQLLKLEDRMQIVLLDSNSDNIPDDTNLVLKINTDSTDENGNTEFKIIEVPLSLKNGELTVSNPNMRY